MTIISKELRNLEVGLQHYAAQGLLSCKVKKSEDTMALVKTIALNIFSSIATIAAIVYTLSIAVPIVLGVGTLGLLAYNVYSVYVFVQDSSINHQCKAIFTDIVQAKFADAHQKTDRMLNFTPDRKGVGQQDQLERCLIVADPRWPLSVYSSRLHSATIFLQALAEISAGAVKTEEQVQIVGEEIKKWGDGMRCGHDITKKWIQTIKEANAQAPGFFSPTPVKPNAAFLLLGMIKELKYFLSESSFEGEDPSKWGGGVWESDGKETFNFVKQIQTQESETVGPCEKEIMDNVLECKNLKEIWTYVVNIPESTRIALEQRTN